MDVVTNNKAHINNKFAKAWWIEGYLFNLGPFAGQRNMVEERKYAEEAWIYFCNQ